MEQTTLQQRIEERAKKRLAADIRKAYNMEADIQSILSPVDYKHKLDNQTAWNGKKWEYRDEYTQSVFDELLPKYIAIVTDEILDKIDQIDFLLESNQTEDLPY